MSKSVEDRIVSMEFDNSKFESNVQNSMNTIEALKKSLNFDGVSKGFENIEKAVGNVSFENIEHSVSSLENRFSTLGIVGMRVIENLTDTAMGYAKKALSFVTDGIIQGGLKRATNLENAQFQLQGLLKEDEKVKAVMQDVNNAVDGTAYSLDAAAKVASQLAASGMTAGNEMFKTLRGIAGVAAMTNSSYEDIGNVFTKVAGQGRVMADDLNRLAARGMNAAATLADSLGVTEAEVREMVSDSKVSFNMFAMAMDDAFGEHAKNANATVNGAFSNIKAALGRIGALFVSPIIVQNGELVKALNIIREKTNDIKKNIEPIAEYVTGKINRVLSEVSDKIKSIDITSSYGNTSKRIDAISTSLNVVVNVLSTLKSVLSPVMEALKESNLIPSLDSFNSFGHALESFTEKLKLTDDEASKIKNTFGGVFSFAKLLADVFKTLITSLGNGLSKLTGIKGGILDLAEAFGLGLSEMTASIRSGGLLKSIDGIGNGIGKLITRLKDAISELGVFQAIEDLTTDLFQNTGKVLSGAINIIGSGLKSLVSVIGDVLTNGDLKFALDGTIFATILYNVKKVLIQIRKFVDKNNPVGGLGQVLVQLKDSLFEWERNLSADYFIKIGAALLMLGGALLMISSVDSDKIILSLGAIMTMMVGLTKSLKQFDKLSINKSFGKVKRVMIPFAASIFVLASALTKIGSLNWEDMTKGLIGTIGLASTLVGTIALLSKVQGQWRLSPKTALILLGLAESINILANAFVKMDSISWDGIGKGLTVMSIGLAELIGSVAILNKVGGIKSLAGSISILIIVGSLHELANGLQSLGSMSWDTIEKGLVTMGGALGELILTLTILSTVSGFSSILSAGAISIVADSLEDISESLNTFGSMSWDEIEKSLVSMGGALGELVLALTVLGTVSGFSGIFASGEILIVSNGLTNIADALNVLGKMTWDEIYNGLVSLGGALGELVVALTVLGTVSGFSGIFAAGSILIVTSGLNDISDALKNLGSMTWDEIDKGLVAMGGALGELVLALTILNGVTGFASLFGGGAILLISKGLSDLADGLAKFGEMDWPEIGKGLAAMSGAFVSLAGGGLLNTLSLLGSVSIAKVAEPLGVLADSMKKWVGVTIPQDLGIKLAQIADGLLGFTFGGIGAGPLEKVAAPFGELADSVRKWNGITISETLKTDLKSLAEGINAFAWSFTSGFSIDSVIGPMGRLLESVKEWNTVEIPTDLSDKLRAFAEGFNSFADSISDKSGELKQATKNIVYSTEGMFNSIAMIVSSNGVKLSDAMKTVFEGINNAVISISPKIVKTAGSMAEQVVNKTAAMMNNQQKFYDAGYQGARGFANGLLAGKNIVGSAGWELGYSAYLSAKSALDINSPSKKFDELGEFSGLGFANALDRMRKRVSASSLNMTNSALSTVKDAITKISGIVQNDIDVQPRIRPVVDLTDARIGARTLSSMFNADPSIGIANQISRNYRNSAISSSDLLSAIRELGAVQQNNGGNTYQINGISYNDDGAVADAIRTIVRAANVERRA